MTSGGESAAQMAEDGDDKRKNMSLVDPNKGAAATMTLNLAGGEKIVVSRAEAQGERRETIQRLFSGKKLSLVLDIDHTMLHTTGDARAPDYSKTVDIHRKPGYDPVELFIDPEIRQPMLAVGSRLARKKMGFRTLLDVISNKDTHLVKGSHGRPTDSPEHGPLVISSDASLLPEGEVDATEFKQLVLDHIFVEEQASTLLDKAG